MKLTFKRVFLKFERFLLISPYGTCNFSQKIVFSCFLFSLLLLLVFSSHFYHFVKSSDLSWSKRKRKKKTFFKEKNFIEKSSQCKIFSWKEIFTKFSFKTFFHPSLSSISNTRPFLSKIVSAVPTDVHTRNKCVESIMIFKTYSLQSKKNAKF